MFATENNWCVIDWSLAQPNENETIGLSPRPCASQQDNCNLICPHWCWSYHLSTVRWFCGGCDSIQILSHLRRECIRQYLTSSIDDLVRKLSSLLSTRPHAYFWQPDCSVCHVALTIYLEAPALKLDKNIWTAGQSMLGRLDLGAWQSSIKIEAFVDKLINSHLKDATTKSIVFSQFVNVSITKSWILHKYW